ncbi:hypothetical protein UCRPA7_5072 [Phaeoacremonium minimum UCRPA7]|uniref:LYR motif-containing protein Cup1-like N-terminal domain-containing protein n=1 Tax=Phaeoacremonium minimum (strain UCR-PA7) TaxID=1286976 RepID=R8BJL8_PHAM7|nr:hypothetical protein UCRPA7_5072 [Phaeoacremonium minimum UCRPA7]EON99407.1 hypothetical protein UCRPA7_5072 [Phaeoacremonium minimum UCRPA7]
MGALRPEQPRSPIHLYRHLLREAGYLPPVCRPYVTSRIQLQFRRHRRDSEPDRHLHQASHDLRYLRAANAGDMPRMRRILLFCFGRAGPRRRQLINHLVAPDPPANSIELTKHIKNMDKDKRPGRNNDDTDNTQPRRSDFLDQWHLPKLLQFVKSQASLSLADSPRPKIRTKRKLDPAANLPTENSFGHPLYPKVYRTKLRKGWKDMINRVLPPVEKGEWELLQALATGQAKPELWQVPARRPVAGESSVTHGLAAWDWERLAQNAVRHLEMQRSRRLKLLSGEIDDGPYGQGEPLHIHRYTPRFWRRTYAKLWGLTATMEKRQGTKDAWDIRWGGADLALSECSPEQKEFFEILDMNGATDRTLSRAKPSSATRSPMSSP